MRVVELFSGIGSQAKALKRINAPDLEILNTSEWEIHAIIAYDIIHNGNQDLSQYINKNKEELIALLSPYTLSANGKTPATNKSLKGLDKEVLMRLCCAIKRTKNLVNVRDIKGEMLPDTIDLMTYSFPCQDLSNVGAFHGYKNGIDRNANTRSGMIWEVGRILTERKHANLDLPKFLLLENVTTLESKRHNGNFEIWKDTLKDLGYYNVVYKLNALDFGVPQNRKRLLMISIFTAGDKRLEESINGYLKTNNLENPNKTKLGIKDRKLNEFLKLDYSIKKYEIEADLCQPLKTSSRMTIWNKNPKLYNENMFFRDFVPTITTKQDRHPNSGNIYYPTQRNHYRFLTPRECFLLMGFDEIDFDKIFTSDFHIKAGRTTFFSRDKLYKLAGNSIVVNILEQVFKQIISIKSQYNI